MDTLYTLLFLVLLSVVYVTTQKNTSNRLVILLTTLVVVMVLCYLQMRREAFAGCHSKKEGFKPAPVDHRLGRCGGFKYADKVDVDTETGNYDGLVLKSGKLPHQVLPADKVAIHSPVGDAYALNPDDAYTAGYTTVDGKKDSPKQAFMMAYNRSSPDCCPATFSSSLGCVCLSQDQSDFINRRGHQKSVNGNPDF